MASVKVAVRVRPFNQREIDMDSQLIIQMRGKTTGILNNKANTRDESIRYKEFTFDYSYWSHDEKSENYASQQLVYNDLGTEVVDCAFQGYNACVFAYGQTGSGKTFTMMGSPNNQGLIPRICKALFERMAENSKKGITHRVQVSYLEIYQERVMDLLRGGDTTTLKVREHPVKGPYVQGLTTCLVANFDNIQGCMDKGNAHRTTAATNMNDVSSRSHAIFTISFVQAGYCDGVPSETVSKIHLVDLAGSERADSTGATGKRLKEGAHINKSLVTLGSVISALAEISSDNGQKKSLFIPYRDSVLTWLLKDSLGGNSKTIMIAAISPADCNYGETLSTLRYANRAKNIINKPTVNEDPNVKLIRELRNEISKLKALMFSEQRSDMLATLHEKEAREKELTEEWAGKWREAQAILREQTALGLRKSGPGVILDSDRPHLVAIDDDPLTTGVTLYHLKEGTTTIGTEDSEIKQDIELRGAGMEPQHCTIVFENGVATLHPHLGAHVMLNNMLIDTPCRLSQGCIIFLGKAHVFRFNDPAEAAELRKGEKQHNLSRLSMLSWSTPDLANSMENLNRIQDDDRSEIENQRLSIEKDKQELEKGQEMFEKKRKELEDAQAKLEEEKKNMIKQHSKQSRQLEQTWRSLNAQQREKEMVLREREKGLIMQREELERERQQLLGEIYEECDFLRDIRSEFLSKLQNFSQFVLLKACNFYFIDEEQKILFQELLSKSLLTPLSETESDCLVEVLNTVKGNMAIQDLVIKHRKELAELQDELNHRVQMLSERKKTIDLLDKKLISLVEEQVNLDNENKDANLEALKQSLASRTKEEIEKIERRKQSLTLNLKKIDSRENVQANKSADNDEKGTSSSDLTYHTAASSCSPILDYEKDENIMSDSGVELKLTRRPEESDGSSNDESKNAACDSQSSSSLENYSPIHRKKRKDSEIIRKINFRISQQKQLIWKSLNSNYTKEHLDTQIAVLQDLQKRQMTLKYGPSVKNSVLSPASEHPLQDIDSPSPLQPLYMGSSITLYSPSSNYPNQHISYNRSLHRSMPSIAATNCDAIVSISSYCVRGTGSKTHYEYEVRIVTVDDQWYIMRRFSRFRDLHIAMKAKYGQPVASIAFPSRRLFPNNETVARSRKIQLEVYIQTLLEVCKSTPSCPLAYEPSITKQALINFSPFFRRGDFEHRKYETS